MKLRRVLRSDDAFPHHFVLPACFVCSLFPSWLSTVIDFFQELKIEGEQPEVLEEDNLDLMLPTKKKKSKKVEIDEGDALDKDDGKN